MMNFLTNTWIKYIFIVIMTIIVTILFTFKINKKQKKIITFSFVLLLIISLISIFNRFIELKKLNRLDNSVYIAELEGLTLDELDQVGLNSDIGLQLFNKLLDRHIHIDLINESEYDEYKKILLIDIEGYNLKDAVYISFGELWKKLNNKNGDLDKYLKEFNITKDDKILLLCYAGSSSIIMNYFLLRNGYDVYFANLEDVSNEHFIQFETPIKKIGDKENIIVDSFNYNINENYYFFIFENLQYHIELERFFPFIENGKIKDNILGIRESTYSEIIMKKKYPELEIYDINEIDIEKVEIVCLTHLHCLLTKHKINELGLEIRKIYYAESMDNS